MLGMMLTAPCPLLVPCPCQVPTRLVSGGLEALEALKAGALTTAPSGVPPSLGDQLETQVG